MNRFYILMAAFILFLSSPVVGQQKMEGVSAPVSLNIRKKKLPPILSVKNIRFEDIDGNSRIDGLEATNILFSIENAGTGPATGMTMNVNQKSDIKGLEFAKQTTISTIQPGNSVEIKIPVNANINLTDGLAEFAIGFDESLGFPPDPFDIKVETKAFQTPFVKVADYLFITSSGIVKKGLPVQLKTLVQNTGQGEAEQVVVKFNYPQRNVYPNSEEQFTIGTLNPGETREIVFEFLPNKLYAESTIPIQITLKEKFGSYSENSSVEAKVDSRAENRTVAVTSTAVDQQFEIANAMLTAEVDRNVPENFPKKINRYALIIGNEDYTIYQPGLSSESNVPFAIADARTFAKYAEKTLAIPAGNITVLENAISSAFNREIEKLTKLIQYTNGQAEVFFFYAGHGFPDESSNGVSYLMPVDISGASVKQGIPLSKLYADLTNFPAKKVTVFLDACFSGGGREASLLAARGLRIKPQEESISGNLVVFTASSGDQTALPYMEKKHGIFTYYLLKTLQESKGNITYRKLYDQLKQNVELNSIKINNKDQNPKLIYSTDVSSLWEEWMLN